MQPLGRRRRNCAIVVVELPSTGGVAVNGAGNPNRCSLKQVAS